MKIIKTIILAGLMALSLNFMSCDANGDFLIFGIGRDMELGAQMDAEIESDNTQFPILSRTRYPEAYAYLDDMVDHILTNGDVTYKDDFAWEVHIIDQPVLNAFVTPGGYIYVYNGLIQYLDNADDLAGVIGHEIAHADQRHSSKQLQRQYGVSLLISIALGEDATELEKIVAGIASTVGTLAFSRAAESEADAFSVEYLANSRYACNGAATFFEKLTEEGQSSTPAFLSTHPVPATRVEEINAKATEESCSTSQYTDSDTSYDCDANNDYLCFKEDWLPDLPS